MVLYIHVLCWDANDLPLSIDVYDFYVCPNCLIMILFVHFTDICWTKRGGEFTAEGEATFEKGIGFVILNFCVCPSLQLSCHWFTYVSKSEEVTYLPFLLQEIANMNATFRAYRATNESLKRMKVTKFKCSQTCFCMILFLEYFMCNNL